MKGKMKGKWRVLLVSVVLILSIGFALNYGNIWKFLSPTQITCHLSATTIEEGQSVTISGAITPGILAPVTIQISNDGKTWTSLAMATSSSDGSYSYLWASTYKDVNIGTYKIRTSWPGDKTHNDATSSAVSLIVKEITTISPKLSPNPTPQVTINLLIPREINQTNYSQHLENLKITYNIPPSGIATDLTDEYRNTYKGAYWNVYPGKQIIVTIEAEITRKVMKITPVTTSDSYPIPKHLIPYEAIIYLKPGFDTQSDDPAIISLAKNLSQGCTKEIDIVNNILKWVYNNINQDVPCKDIKRSEAVWVLEHRIGHCFELANLATALLKANGIPARVISEFRYIPFDLKPVYLEAIEQANAHAAIEVYFPEVGWVHYDQVLPIVLSHIPYGIPFEDGLGGGVIKSEEIAKMLNLTILDLWMDWTYQVEGTGTLENNTVKLIITIVFPMELE